MNAPLAKQDLPLVSIMIPVHRFERFKQALRCALAQTYEHTEIIVLDNGIDSRIEAYCQAVPQVNYVRNHIDISRFTFCSRSREQHTGELTKEKLSHLFSGTPNQHLVDLDSLKHEHIYLTGSISKEIEPRFNVLSGLEHANGEYIKYICDDDIVFPHCVATMIGEVLRAEQSGNSKIGVVSSDKQVIDENDKVIREFGLQREEGGKRTGDVVPAVYDGRNIIKNVLLWQSNIIGELSTVLIAKKYIPEQYSPNKKNKFTHNFIGLYDVALYCELLENSNFLYVPATLSSFRKSGTSGSDHNQNPDFYRGIHDWFSLLRFYSGSGLFSAADTRFALTRFLGLINTFKSGFEKELQNVDAETQEWLAGLNEADLDRLG